MDDCVELNDDEALKNTHSSTRSLPTRVSYFAPPKSPREPNGVSGVVGRVGCPLRWSLGVVVV